LRDHPFGNKRFSGLLNKCALFIRSQFTPLKYLITSWRVLTTLFTRENVIQYTITLVSGKYLTNTRNGKHWSFMSSALQFTCSGNALGRQLTLFCIASNNNTLGTTKLAVSGHLIAAPIEELK